MELIRRWIIVCNALCLCFVSGAQAEELSTETTPSSAGSDQSYVQLSVEVARAYAPEVTAVVANIGKPTAWVMKSGDTFGSVTRSLCGHTNVNVVYAVAFMRENTISPDKIVALDEGQTYLFPACLWNSQVSYEVQDKEFPSKIFSKMHFPFAPAEVEKPDHEHQSPVSPAFQKYVDIPEITPDVVKEMITAGRGFTAAEAARTFSRLNPGINSKELNKRGQSIIIKPEQRLSGVIILRDPDKLSEAKLELKSALKSVAKAPKGTELYGEENEVLASKVGELEPASLIADVDYDGPCDWSNESPISINELRKARDENARLRPSDSPRDPIKVLFLDTGYDPRLGPPAISKGDLGSIKRYKINYLPGGVSGFNPLVPERHSDAMPPDKLPSRMHGSEVAATFLGGSFLLEEDRAQNPAKVIFASLAVRNELKAEAASEALTHAAENKVDIVNASFVARSNSASFLVSLKNKTPPFLLIAAAGNDGAKFSSEDRSWPGRLGGLFADGNLPSVIISVGAHDPQKKLLPFSRVGSSSVDLLAPGCNIPTYSLDENWSIIKVKRNGTSYAAPLVTMVAAELAREGMMPYQIRNRLIYSVDVNRDLDGFVRSSGTLNLGKALSVYQDIVELSEEDPLSKQRIKPRRISGTLENRASSVTCQGETYKYDDLLKFAYAGRLSTQNSNRRLYIWTRPAYNESQLMVSRTCERDELENAPPLKIFNSELKITEEIPLNNVDDFVARTYPPSDEAPSAGATPVSQPR